MERKLAFRGLSALLAVGVAAAVTVLVTGDKPASSPSSTPLPPERPAAPAQAAPMFEPYRSPIGERFDTFIPSTWTARPSASGEGTSISFEDPAAGGGMRIFFFHDFVSEQGVREHMSRKRQAMQVTSRSRQWPWSFAEYETAWTQGDTNLVGAIGIGHTGNRWYEVSWESPEARAATHRANVDAVLDRLVWDGPTGRQLARGVVEERFASARTIRLARSDDKVAMVAENPGARLVWDDGRPATGAELRPGLRIEAVGSRTSDGVLLADRIVLASGQPEIGVG
jgi:hypothetical protein